MILITDPLFLPNSPLGQKTKLNRLKHTVFKNTNPYLRKNSKHDSTVSTASSSCNNPRCMAEANFDGSVSLLETFSNSSARDLAVICRTFAALFD